MARPRKALPNSVRTAIIARIALMYLGREVDVRLKAVIRMDRWIREAGYEVSLTTAQVYRMAAAAKRRVNETRASFIAGACEFADAIQSR